LKDYEGDVETIRHPKGELKRLFSRSHAERGKACMDAELMQECVIVLAGRGASEKAFPRSAWEREKSFFVRHVYFTGAGDPYKKLKRALKAEIDEAAWSEIYSTKSRPFDKPATGKIAVKVINHYGDEVLKVFGV
jgi:hypothetical protein